MDLEQRIALQGLFAGSNMTIGHMAEEQRALVAEIADIDRMISASILGALLASPLLQSSAHRLEA